MRHISKLYFPIIVGVKRCFLVKEINDKRCWIVPIAQNRGLQKLYNRLCDDELEYTTDILAAEYEKKYNKA